MKRCRMAERESWQDKVAALGLHWHTDAGGRFWDESVAYQMNPDTVTRLERTAAEVHGLCLEAVEHVVRRERWEDLGVDGRDIETVRQSWHRGDRALHGRFDFLLNADGQPKLLEYNADTPTILLESAVIQREWLNDCLPGFQQWNRIEPLLVEAWRSTGASRVHFAWLPGAVEEEGTARYLATTACMAGLKAEVLPLAKLGWHARRRCFVDDAGEAVTHCYKLYPWEWMLRDSFAGYVLRSDCRFIEPPWKHLLSNKAILALLWKLFPGHPALLPCVLDAELDAPAVVRKPVHGREGCNVTIRRGRDFHHRTDGPYGGRFVEQQFVEAPLHDGCLPLLCVWMIGGQPAGLGIREEQGLVTLNNSRFVPHFMAE